MAAAYIDAKLHLSQDIGLLWLLAAAERETVRAGTEPFPISIPSQQLSLADPELLWSQLKTSAYPASTSSKKPYVTILTLRLSGRVREYSR